MIIKIYKPYTSTTRHKTSIDFSNLSKIKPEKSLIVLNQQAKGRNNQGKITIRHHGGGHKKRYRLIDFKRNKYNIKGIVSTIEYDPYRNAYISLINYLDGEKRYILHPETLKIGDSINTGLNVEIKVGNCLPLFKIPVGIEIHNLEFIPNKGGQLIRSAGNSGIILAKEKDLIIIRLPSKEILLFKKECYATIVKIINGQNK